MRFWRTVLAVCTNLIIVSISAFGQPAVLKTFPECGRVVGSEAITGNSFTAEGKTLILAWIMAPRYWPESQAHKSWPHSETSKNYLNSLVQDKKLSLHCTKKAENRRKQLKVQVISQDIWLQAEMIKSGQAFLYPDPSISSINTELYASLQKIEKSAHDQKQGLWALKAYQIINAENIKEISDRTGYFQFIRGRVLSAKRVRQTIYLNFGENWRRDFTVEIDTKAQKYFKNIGLDPLSLEGQKIEVRGWVDYKGGPRMEILSPYHLTILVAQ
jgi:endonuclease YncB( thermonuclease family)